MAQVGRDRAVAEAEVERPEGDLAEGQRHGKVEDPPAVGGRIGVDGRPHSRRGEPGRAFHRLADEGHVGVREDLALGTDHRHVGHVGIADGVLDQDVEVQGVVGEERGLGARGEVLGHGEAALGHLVGQGSLPRAVPALVMVADEGPDVVQRVEPAHEVLARLRMPVDDDALLRVSGPGLSSTPSGTAILPRSWR